MLAHYFVNERGKESEGQDLIGAASKWVWHALLRQTGLSIKTGQAFVRPPLGVMTPSRNCQSHWFGGGYVCLQIYSQAQWVMLTDLLSHFLFIHLVQTHKLLLQICLFSQEIATSRDLVFFIIIIIIYLVMWISPLAFFLLSIHDGCGGRYWQTIKQEVACFLCT